MKTVNLFTFALRCLPLLLEFIYKVKKSRRSLSYDDFAEILPILIDFSQMLQQFRDNKTTSFIAEQQAHSASENISLLLAEQSGSAPLDNSSVSTESGIAFDYQNNTL